MHSSFRAYINPFLSPGTPTHTQRSVKRAEPVVASAANVLPNEDVATSGAIAVPILPLPVSSAQSAHGGIPPLALAARAALATATSAKTATVLGGGQIRAVQLCALVPVLLAAGQAAVVNVGGSSGDALGGTTR